jgi:D-serine deaminase-like pyridoxal phosphate-dependent protein
VDGPADGARGVTRRAALGSAMGAALALKLGPSTALARPAGTSSRATAPAAAADLGAGGRPMTLAAVAALARRVGNGEPLAIVDLAAVDHNCRMLLDWSAAHGIAWRPAFKTLRSPDLLEYVLAKLDRPRAMIHHLRDLPQAMTRAPAGTDFLMGYPPTLGELQRYLSTRPARGERVHRLRINVDSLALLKALADLSKHTARRPPVEVVLEIYNGSPRGGFEPGPELSQALSILRVARGRLRLSALMCYDAIASASSDPATLKTVGRFAQRELTQANEAVAAQAHDFVDVARLIRNGPASSNYPNWEGSTAANEFSAGSAVLFADYLDTYGSAAGLAKALYLCAPVLRLPRNSILDAGGVPVPPGSEVVFIKAGGWPTGNNPTLSKLAYPPGLGEGAIYGRGSNVSGLITAPVGRLRLGDYVLETAQQVMEGQDYFGELYAVRGGRVRARWATLTRWSGERPESAA